LIWNKEELPHQWKESIVVSIRKKGDKTDWSNYRGTSLLATSYKILSNILLSRITACGFRRSRSTAGRIFYILQIIEKMGVQWYSTSATYRFQKSLRFT
jgi:hypothetical protein